MSNDLISRKALLDKIGWWIEDIGNAHLLDERYYRAMKRAETFVEEMPAVAAAPTWISVEDRLPDDYERVLVWRSRINDVDVFDGRSVQIRCETAEMRRIHGITHWMPLPEPPKDA